MPSNPQELAGSHFVRRMALFYASVFIALGVHLPFLPVWLAAKGLDPQTIGVVLAMPMILRLFAIPLATRAADRHDALRAGHHGRYAGRACGLRDARSDGEPACDRRALCARGDRLHAAVRSVRRLCAARPRAPPAGLWAGPAVGLGGVHRGESRRRLSSRHHRCPRPDLADRRRGDDCAWPRPGRCRRSVRGLQPAERDAAGARAAARSRDSSRWPRRRA